jgi:TPR repeat protein
MAYSDMPMGDLHEVEVPESNLCSESDADAIYQVGLAYSAGVGVEIDLVAAHKWFNLAAMAGSDEAKLARREMAEMLSTAEIAEALKSAREWMALAN